MTNTWRTKSRLLQVCVAIVGLAMLSACADGDNDDSGSEASGMQVEQGDDDSSRAVGDEAAAPISASAVSPTELADRKLIKTGTIALEGSDVDRLLSDVDGIVTVHQGIIESEDVRTDDNGDAKSATVVIRVPVDRSETAVDAISELGTLIRRQTSSEDVTTKVADIDARVASAERSIASLQRLFSRANKLGDVIALESELSRRQADLESLQAQQRSLARQTVLSTIHVSITKSEAAPEKADDDQAGFVDGVESGWSGLVTFVQGTAHVVGLVLPLGTLALLVAVPVWLGVRRLHVPSRDRPSE